MAGLKKTLDFSLLLFFLVSFSLQNSAEGHRKVSPSKLPSRVLMNEQSSSPNFYNAFDASFQNPGSMYANSKDSVTVTNNQVHNPSSMYTNNKDNVNFDDNNVPKGDNPFTHKYSTNKELGRNNYDFYPHPYSNSENFANPTSDFRANRGKYNYPTFSSYGGQKSPASFEDSFPNRESNVGKETSSSTGQQGLYDTPYDEKPVYASSSNGKSWYTSSSTDKNLYASSSNEKKLHGSSLSNYKANYPFISNASPSMPKVSEFDEFAKSHPVSNYDNFFSHPTINKNSMHASSLEHPSFPSNNHHVTYGQVQVP